MRKTHHATLTFFALLLGSTVSFSANTGSVTGRVEIVKDKVMLQQVSIQFTASDGTKKWKSTNISRSGGKFTIGSIPLPNTLTIAFSQKNMDHQLRTLGKKSEVLVGRDGKCGTFYLDTTFGQNGIKGIVGHKKD